MKATDGTIKLTDEYKKMKMSYGKIDVLAKYNLSFR